MEERPTAKELHQMSDEDLLYRLMSDNHTTWAALYRSESRSRAFNNRSLFGQAGDQTRNNHKAAPAPAPAPRKSNIAPDISSMIHESELHTKCLRNLVGTILNSGWPMDGDKYMTSDAGDVRDFLESLSWRDQYWYQLNDKAQRKLNTIIDAYGRWWRSLQR